MKAHVYPRTKGIWSIVLELGKEDGKRRQKTYTVRGTKREAEAKATELAYKVESGQYADAGKMTVAEWLDRWMKDSVSIGVGPQTKRSYGATIECWKKKVGHLKLAKLTPLDVQRAMNQLLDEGLAASTVKQRMVVLTVSMNKAMGMDLLHRNPCDGVTRPKQERRQVRALTPVELANVLAAAEGSPYHLPILLAAETGMRRGEVLALQWKDVDLTAGIIHVCRSLSEVGVTKETKTAGSTRQVQLMQTTIDALRMARKAQATLKLGLGKGYRDADLVCAREDGKYMSPSSLTMAFRRIAKTAGYECHLHALRSTHVTLMLEAGGNLKAISERVGHSSAAFTMSVYGGVLPNMQQDAVSKLEKVMEG